MITRSNLSLVTSVRASKAPARSTSFWHLSLCPQRHPRRVCGLSGLRAWAAFWCHAASSSLRRLILKPPTWLCPSCLPHHKMHDSYNSDMHLLLNGLLAMMMMVMMMIATTTTTKSLARSLMMASNITLSIRTLHQIRPRRRMHQREFCIP